MSKVSPYLVGRLQSAVALLRPVDVRLCLEAGVSPDARDQAGHTPLSRCAASAEPAALEIAEMLLEAGAELRQSPHSAEEEAEAGAYLFLAVAAGAAAMVELLLARGSDPRAVTSGGASMLHLCAAQQVLDSAEKVRLLLAAGASIPTDRAALRGAHDRLERVTDSGYRAELAREDERLAMFEAELEAGLPNLAGPGATTRGGSYGAAPSLRPQESPIAERVATHIAESKQIVAMLKDAESDPLAS